MKVRSARHLLRNNGNFYAVVVFTLCDKYWIPERTTVVVVVVGRSEWKQPHPHLFTSSYILFVKIKRWRRRAEINTKLSTEFSMAEIIYGPVIYLLKVA